MLIKFKNVIFDNKQNEFQIFHCNSFVIQLIFLVFYF